MSHAWTHSWCKSPARDEAVRASEDGREGPLPTLEDAIGEPFADSPGASETDRLRADADFLLRLANDQTKDFGELLSVVGNIDARVERLEGMMAKTGSASSAVEHETKGDDMGTKANDQAAAYRFEERRLEAESRRKADIRSGSTWFPASEQPAPAPPAANGLRTERVTLEITIRDGRQFGPQRDGVASLVADYVGVSRSPGESVRVVEEVHFDDLANMAMERDAAIRERDEAIRELRSVAAERAKLEGQLESVADRAAAAETALEAAPAARDLYDIGHKISPFMTLSIGPDGGILEMKFKCYADGAALHGAMVRFFKSAPAASVVPSVIRDMTDILRGNATDDEKHAALSTLVEAVCPGWRMAPAASNSSAILTSSPAASGAAGTEPVAWCVMSSADTPHRVGLHWDQRSADRWARVKQSEYTTKLVVVPLYDRPQAASGAAGNSPAVPVSSGLEAAGTELPTE